MKHQVTAFAVFGGFITSASAIKHAELVSASWCVTYLSTYLAPIGTAGTAPNSSALDSLAPVLSSPTLNIESEFFSPTSVATTSGRQPTGSGQSSIPSVVTISDRSSSPIISASDLSSATSDTPSSETSTGPGISGQQVIFLITPTGDVSKRELRGFVGNSNPQVCTFASVFTLGSGPGSGELFDGDVPLYYQGEDYQALQALGSPPNGAITRTFANEGGTLQFKNPSLPNGQATFCQDSSSGLVYMVFTSGPPNCTPVRLSVYGVEKCVDGRLVGFDESSATSSQATQSDSISVVDLEEETGTSTLPLTSDTSLIAGTSSMSKVAPTTRTKDPLSGTTDPTESASEMSTLAESSGASSLGASPEPSSTVSTRPDGTSSHAEVSSLHSTASSETEATVAPSSIDVPSSALIESSTLGEPPSSAESLDSTEALAPTEPLMSTDIPTSMESLLSSELPTSVETDSTESQTPAELPTSSESLESSDTLVSTEPPTLSESPTTSDLPTTIVEESFVITNSFPGGRFSDGLGDLEISGDVTHHIGGCFKDDGSPDDGCAAMRANGGGAAQPIKAKRGLDTFAGMSTWLGFLRPSTKVLYTVQFYYAVISYGGGWRMCTVEAWLGNRYFYFNDHFVMGSSVTPQNIDRFQLNFEDSPNNPSPSSTRRSSSSSSTSRSLSTPSTPGWSQPGLTSRSTLPTPSLSQPRSTSRFAPSTPGWMPTVSSDQELPGTPSKRSSSTAKSLVIESKHTPLYTPTESWNTPTYSGRTHNSSSSLAHSWNTPINSPSTPVASWHTPTRNPASPTTGEPPKTAIASQPVCPDGWRFPGHCGQAWPTPTTPICERRGWPEGRYYQYTLEEKPLQDLDIQKCAITCAYMDDCFSFSVSPYSPSQPCIFMKQRLGEVPFPEPTPGYDDYLIWSDLECFNCFLCGEMPSSSLWLPNPSTLDGGGHSTPTTPRGPATSDQGGHHTPGPGQNSLTNDYWEHSTPTPSRRPTTTSQAPESSTSTCRYTHGELCQFNHKSDLLCSYAAKYTGETWTESRNDYPHQDRWEQCAAICQTLEGCQSAGYYMVENRCLFTSATITISDMIIYDDDPWKHSIWTDKRCWTCPDCIPESVPIIPSNFCSYTPGDSCNRVGVSEDIICNLPAYMPGGYWTGDQWTNQYPLQLQGSNEECAAICRAIQDCKGSGWKDGLCMFSAFKLSLSPDDPVPLQTDNPSLFNAVWDDPACFNCPGCYQVDE
ncbi:hypothetical protein LCI18_004078 [Fusarium solani-melongenae]|uniref:Uncharacterized protein n=1 Tax=Fusarium solani subsp. cucurbitae TaxID=2747967 RepID=A0ACD3YVX7_FUSSC|nr:hypothetical protein LCI18_004078 [Fusarium solani-melongenae]